MSSGNTVHVLRVKLWLERTGRSDNQADSSEWRGEVLRLETGETAYFRHLSGFEEGVRKIGIDNEETN